MTKRQSSVRIASARTISSLAPLLRTPAPRLVNTQNANRARPIPWRSVVAGTRAGYDPAKMVLILQTRDAQLAILLWLVETHWHPSFPPVPAAWFSSVFDSFAHFPRARANAHTMTIFHSSKCARADLASALESSRQRGPQHDDWRRKD